jgi:hypothetical protein
VTVETLDDEVSRTAIQVRAHGSKSIHRVHVTRTTTEGRIYRTACGEEFSNVIHQAVLTTRRADCGRCAGIRRGVC